MSAPREHWKVVMAAKVDPRLYEQFSEYAHERGITRSAAIEQAIQLTLEAQHGSTEGRRRRPAKTK